VKKCRKCFSHLNHFSSSLTHFPIEYYFIFPHYSWRNHKQIVKNLFYFILFFHYNDCDVSWRKEKLASLYLNTHSHNTAFSSNDNRNSTECIFFPQLFLSRLNTCQNDVVLHENENRFFYWIIKATFFSTSMLWFSSIKISSSSSLKWKVKCNVQCVVVKQ
jgi:hypothetical protein